MDCLVIGGGPAGLTAAIHLARFRRPFLLVDAGRSRAAWIPLAHNHPGYPEGIAGKALLKRMRIQAERYGAGIVRGEVARLERRPGGGFLASMEDGTRHEAERVLLASGTEDLPPPLPLPRLERAVARGLVRYCPLSDAFEVRGRKIALVASRERRLHEALLLRGYTADLTLLTPAQAWELSEAERRTLGEAGIGIVEMPAEELAFTQDRAAIRTIDGDWHRFECLYLAPGLRARSGLATALGAEHDAGGALAVDARQETTVPGLFAAGDVVRGLAQISVAMGQAAIAAAIHNGLPLPQA